MPILSLAFLLVSYPQTAAKTTVPPTPPTSQAAAPTSAQTPATTPASSTPNSSAAMQPAIDSLRGILVLVRVEKWKTSNPVREAASSNLDSIQRDLDSTLPPLLKTADASPNAVTQLLPVFRNVNALYDVLLRVSTAAEPAAPRPQADGLKQSLVILDTARRSIGDAIQTNAAAYEQQIADLQTQLAAAKAAAIPPPPPAAPPVTAAKPKPKPKKKAS